MTKGKYTARRKPMNKQQVRRKNRKGAKRSTQPEKTTRNTNDSRRKVHG
jgi:hypothetical protein